MARILLTHSPEARVNYYGARALTGLQALGSVVLNQDPQSLEGDALVRAAADFDLIVSYRQSPAPAAGFERLPGLIAFVRCAVDIRNVNVDNSTNPVAFWVGSNDGASIIKLEPLD